MMSKVNTHIQKVPTDNIRLGLEKMKDFLESQLVNLTQYEEGIITLEEFQRLSDKEATELDPYLESLDVIAPSPLEE